MTAPYSGKGWGETGKSDIIFFSDLSKRIDEYSAIVKSMVGSIQAKTSAMTIADMFDVQAAMNKLSQFTEAASSLIAGLNTMAQAVSRNIKG